MSCDWFYYCETCKVDGWGAGADFNNMSDELIRLLDYFPLLVQIGKANIRVDVSRFGFCSSRDDDVARWAVQHEGHDILVKSEYGQIFGLCSKPIQCPTCEHKSYKCSLPVRHDGNCAQ